MKVVDRKISELIPAEYNPRYITDEALEHLKASIQRFEAVEPVLVNMHPDRKNIIISGHQRIKAAKSLGLETFPCVELNLDKDKERELNIRMNKNTGAWDWDELAVHFDVEELTDWGFSEDELFGNIEEEEHEAEEDDYEVPDEIQTDIVLGDLIEIGDHRLLCGDSTDSDMVQKLLEGAEPMLMVTDPPYGVNYDANWRNKALRKDGSSIGARATGKVSNDDNADWTQAWSISPSKVAYVWHAGKYAGIVQKSLEDCGYEIVSQIIWNKSNFAIGRGDYHWKHEPCWYAVKKGSKHHFIAGRDQSTVWDIPKPSKSETGHSTQKHIDCMAIPIQNHEGAVYDPFLGSGTTMVAAHQLKRKCYGMELDPKYCQVIIDRMQKAFPELEVKINGNPYKKAA